MRNTYSQKKAVPVVRLVTEPGYASARETPLSLINDVHLARYLSSVRRVVAFRSTPIWSSSRWIRMSSA